MSLLILDGHSKTERWAQLVYDHQFAEDPQLQHEFDQRRRRRMLEDIHYNLEILATAIRFDAEALMVDHARWIFELLAHRMADIPRERICQQMTDHYRSIMAVLRSEIPDEQYEKAVSFLEKAIEATETAAARPPGETAASENETADEYQQLRTKYSQAVLAAQREEAAQLITNAVERGVPLEDIYLKVFQPAMYSVGELWHAGQISVDKEHYFTVMTQSIMTRLYPHIFSTPRNGCSVVACCVGNELHEMGIRMVCDIFEVHGWDSIYLGSSVPEDAIIASLEEHTPDLVALSVTMPHHLSTSQSIVEKIRAHPTLAGLRVALGGQAFRAVPSLPQAWGADYTTQNARQLVAWANDNIRT